MQMELSNSRFLEIVNDIHLSIIAQTASLAPADKQIYALRNVTATVNSIPLIAGSIMSKKLAAGSDGIVLDVKTGKGAFMQSYQDSLDLAQTMVNIGEGAGKRVVALITSMEQPLGNAVGNAIEVKQAIDTLKGNGPLDLVDLVIELGSNMLLISGIVNHSGEAQTLLKDALDSGKGLKKLGQLIKAQGGNKEVIHQPELLPQPKTKIEIESETAGYVQSIDALEVGMAAKILGAGRKTKDDPIDLSIGISLLKKVGDRVNAGEPLAIFHSDGDEEKIGPTKKKVLDAYKVAGSKVKPPRLFLARVSKEGVEEL
jgi:pyrimidine-nucleoside phosphorylase